MQKFKDPNIFNKCIYNFILCQQSSIDINIDINIEMNMEINELWK